MEIQCVDLESLARPLLEQMQPLLEAVPARLTMDVDEVQGLISNLIIAVSESSKWVLEATGFSNIGVIRISKKTVEYQWVFNYAYLAIYRKKFQGQQIGGEIRLDDDPDLVLPREILTWTQRDIAAFGDASPPEIFPRPNLQAEHGTLIEAASTLTLHSMRFHFFHELAHLFFRLQEIEFDRRIDEERACDDKAIAWTMHLTPLDDERDGSYIYAGAAFALLHLVAHGIDSGQHDGVTHPRLYDRLVTTLDRHFAPDNDLVWGPATAILGGHCSNQLWFIPAEWVPQGGFESFRECVGAFRDLIHETAPPPYGEPI